MSLFQFLASDKLLEEVRNPYRELISISEALIRNIKVPDFLINDIKFDRDKKLIMACESEEQLKGIEIKHNMYYSSEYAEKYSKKQHFSELCWRYTDKRANKLIDYLKEELNNVDEIEIWSIWLEDYKTPYIEYKNINELTIDDLKFMDIPGGYKNPQCLIVTR